MRHSGLAHYGFWEGVQALVRALFTAPAAPQVVARADRPIRVLVLPVVLTCAYLTLGLAGSESFAVGVER